MKEQSQYQILEQSEKEALNIEISQLNAEAKQEFINGLVTDVEKNLPKLAYILVNHFEYFKEELKNVSILLPMHENPLDENISAQAIAMFNLLTVEERIKAENMQNQAEQEISKKIKAKESELTALNGKLNGTVAKLDDEKAKEIEVHVNDVLGKDKDITNVNNQIENANKELVSLSEKYYGDNAEVSPYRDLSNIKLKEVLNGKNKETENLNNSLSLAIKSGRPDIAMSVTQQITKNEEDIKALQEIIKIRALQNEIQKLHGQKNKLIDDKKLEIKQSEGVKEISDRYDKQIANETNDHFIEQTTIGNNIDRLEKELNEQKGNKSKNILKGIYDIDTSLKNNMITQGTINKSITYQLTSDPNSLQIVAKFADEHSNPVREHFINEVIYYGRLNNLLEIEEKNGGLDQSEKVKIASDLILNNGDLKLTINIISTIDNIDNQFFLIKKLIENSNNNLDALVDAFASHENPDIKGKFAIELVDHLLANNKSDEIEASLSKLKLEKNELNMVASHLFKKSEFILAKSYFTKAGNPDQFTTYLQPRISNYEDMMYYYNLLENDSTTIGKALAISIKQSADGKIGDLYELKNSSDLLTSIYENANNLKNADNKDLNTMVNLAEILSETYKTIKADETIEPKLKLKILDDLDDLYKENLKLDGEHKLNIILKKLSEEGVYAAFKAAVEQTKKSGVSSGGSLNPFDEEHNNISSTILHSPNLEAFIKAKDKIDYLLGKENSKLNIADKLKKIFAPIVSLIGNMLSSQMLMDTAAYMLGAKSNLRSDDINLTPEQTKNIKKVRSELASTTKANERE